MEEHQRDGVTLDVCTGCGGLWLDPGELEQLLGACPPAQGSASQYRKCPHCQVAMKRVQLGPVGVERCASCQGYFFDAGELEQLARLRPAKAVAAARDPSEAEAVTSFTCQKCSRHLPRDQGYAVPGGHVCDACSGFVSPREGADPGPLGRLLARFVETLPTHRRSRFFSLWADWD
jgi:Zn-finger nucleic acid-binding protein